MSGKKNPRETTLTEEAYQKLRWDIVSGTLEAGSPLRLENLKQRYGLGYSPLREALNRLHSERLVMSVALRGFTVAPLSLTEMWDAVDTRIHIEAEALRRAIEFGDDDWETEVISAFHGLSLKAKKLEQMDAPPMDEMKALEDRHHRFHRALISACRSNWLLDFSDKLYVETERYRFPVLGGPRARPSRDLTLEHQEIMDATIARDAEKAIALLSRHYRRTGETLSARYQPDAKPMPAGATA
ncbi:FCD domain-containing protein [Nitratireductor rhodophyticola]|uniref:GntR family transcriptional regulator n=1 Tax=Nitratireductor rhodophyticola TaxID=2854036 RepID=UPI002AC980E2|nr:FCD domain-containing protein [Nitratireductor rhodophyticola]WPZ14682.1 FCD domain-containing protein [Nitratireductor rhodophyticola]